MNRTTLAALATVAIAGIGTGSALAATGSARTARTTPADEQAALITALAGKLDISVDTLKAALVATAKDRVAAALATGTITQAEADAANTRIDAGQGLLGWIGGPGLGHRHGPGGGVGLDAAASFLGMTRAELRAALQGGKTLADLALAKGKTAAALEDAMVAAETAEIRASTNLTDAQRTQILSDLTARVKKVVESALPAGGPGFDRPWPGERGGHGPGFGDDALGAPGQASWSGATSRAQLATGTGA